jgi:hypothetical protein
LFSGICCWWWKAHWQCICLFLESFCIFFLVVFLWCAIVSAFFSFMVKLVLVLLTTCHPSSRRCIFLQYWKPSHSYFFWNNLIFSLPWTPLWCMLDFLNLLASSLLLTSHFYLSNVHDSIITSFLSYWNVISIMKFIV